MSLVIFEHHRTEGPAVLGSILHSYGHRLRHVKLYDGEPVPVDFDDVGGIVSMGGPMNVDQADMHPWLEREMNYLKAAHAARLPIVGVCLGAQLIAEALGGQVSQMDQPEIGWYPLKMSFPGTTDPIFSGIGTEPVQFHIHGQEVTRLPTGATALAGSRRCANQAFRVGLTTYAFQYHFEWDRRDLAVIVRDPFIAGAGLSGQEILGQMDLYYDRYRRLGDRLCHNIATNLFPGDRR